MTYALDNLTVIASLSLGDDRFEAWLAELALASKLGPLEDFAPAFSKRPLSLSVSVIRPNVATVQGGDWPELVSLAGGMVDPIERALSGRLTPAAAVWLEATAEQALASSFAVQSFGGEQAIEVIVFDLVPGAVSKFLQPLGRQALKRICAALEGSGVVCHFMARERASAEALFALGVPTIRDVPALGRCVPEDGEVSEYSIDLSALSANPQKGRLISPLCERVLELCDLRTRAPARVTVRGAADEIARTGAYLEDLVQSRITLRLELTKETSPFIGLDALRASPLLEAAFGGRIEAGRDSDPSAMDCREIRLAARPAKLALELSRRLVDQVGHGLKDINLGGHAIQLDTRP